ncbi:MAG TPA: IS630 family transposase [Herpetosiphonaceae bacterium]
MDQVVVIDESGTHLGMTPRRARAPRGQRAYAKARRNYGTRLSLIAALRSDGMGAAMTIEGAVDGAAFQAYLRDVLAPSLRPGQIVIMDNLSVHKSHRVRQLVEAQGCTLLFLPAYSPDLTPIELAFSKLKTFLRRAGADTIETLQEAISIGLDRITAHDAHSYFRCCGFQTMDQSS